MIQDSRATKEEVEEAARAAQEAAFAAEKAASGAADNAELAGQSATSARDNAELAGQFATSTRDIADNLITYAGSIGGPSDFIYLLAIFALAIFVGYYVVWSVTPALHTPLMSVTNAISSVVIVGALIALGADLMGSQTGLMPKFLGFIAVILASVNIFGGFMVTRRMLAMYQKKQK